MNWTDLVGESLRTPALAARRLIAMGLPRDILYQALLAVAAANAFLASLPNLISTSPVPTPAIFNSPLALFALVAGGLVISVHIFYWAGRAMGGRAGMTDVMSVFIWLQALRAMAQVLILIVGLAAPGLAALLAVVAMGYGLYILVHFLNEANRFESVGRTVGLLIAVMAGLVLGLMLLITLIGATNLGIPNNV